jgi:lauroyl-KDO2-lipid IV(A) myristoyltransferase
MSKGSRVYAPRFRWHFIGPRFWPTWIGMLLLWLLSLAPWRLRAVLARWLGNYAAARPGYRQGIARTNLAMAFPERSETERDELRRGLYRTLVQTLLDYGILWWGSRRRLRRLIRSEGMEHLARARAEGRRVILLTGHNVALDFGAAAFTMEHPGVGLIKRARNELVDWMMGRGRLRFDSVLFERDAGLRPVIGAMREGRVFYYLPDEDLSHVRGSDWVFAPFFGVQTVTITALSRLAGITDAVVLPAMTYYTGDGHYLFRVLPPLEGFPSGDRQADAERQSRILEEMIARAPEQYMWTLTIFSRRPEGEPKPY